MKDFHKNPNFYYLLIPLLAIIWPVWVIAVSLPDARENQARERKEYINCQVLITDILQLDPERLELAQLRNKAGEFSYASAVEQIAKLCRITSPDYKLHTSAPMKVGGQEIQAAEVTIETVDIARFSKFLATILLRWPNLQCTQLKLTKEKGRPDAWKAKLKFKYYR